MVSDHFEQMKSCYLSAVLVLVIALSGLLFTADFAQAQADVPALKPGSTFFVDFPQLGKTWAKQPARMGVYIPKDYTPEKKFPLFVWFGGGFGSDNPGPAKDITGGSGFICVGLPYKFQDDENKDGEKGGWSGTPWAYYKTMLDVMHERVPNVHPKNRVCGGFSSGGCAVLRQIQVSKGDFQKYFSGFLPGGAGWDMGGLETIKGRPMLAFVGEKDERFGGYAELEKKGLAAGVDIKLLVFKGVGHSMPGQYFPEMREWIMQKVVLRNLKTLPTDLKREMAASNWGKAYQCAIDLQAISADGSPEHGAASQALEQLGKIGKAESAKLSAPGAPLAAMQKFVVDWEGSDFVKPVYDKCTEIANTQLKAILSQNPVSPENLKKYLVLWAQFPVKEKAMGAYDECAKKVLADINSKPSKTYKAESLARFVVQWDPAPCLSEAKQALEQLGKEMLEEIKLGKSKVEKKSKLETFLRTYKGTLIAAEAQQLLDELRQRPPSKH